jgi:hypothetical protein
MSEERPAGPLLSSRVPYAIGNRFDGNVARYPNGAKIVAGRNGSRRDKSARRMLRAKLKRLQSRIGAEVAATHDQVARVRDLCENSHEMRRFAPKERLERRAAVAKARVDYAKKAAGL